MSPLVTPRSARIAHKSDSELPGFAVRWREFGCVITVASRERLQLPSLIPPFLGGLYDIGLPRTSSCAQ